MIPYNPRTIEKKWQDLWAKKKTFAFKERSSSPKFYVLDMFPYPSSEGLHVGHPEGYTATDIIARYQRMRGYNVLHPMGWDAFGLPAENYAIKSGTHPSETTRASINTFKRQIASLGFSYDWSREVNTSDPEYYRWTQWLFLFLYKKGLAYQAEAPVNWCPGCQTVLANEQVIAGECERCGSKVIQKNLTQWFFRVTAYADRLIEGLDTIDWPDTIKTMQRNWIGKSEGAVIPFEIKESKDIISVFTTRPDTIFGATYVVLAPEHELVTKLKPFVKNSKEVQDYVRRTAEKTELERLMEDKKKTGVEMAGIRAINPATGKPIPVWIADYVLGRYGTGAIMAVPGHDRRDHEFAHEFGLPVKRGIKGGKLPYVDEGELVRSGEFSGMSSAEAKKKIVTFVGGEERMLYRLRDWLVSRQRYW